MTDIGTEYIGTECLQCKWCMKAGFMRNYHCFAPCHMDAEMIQGYYMTFLSRVGCRTFKKRGDP